MMTPTTLMDIIRATGSTRVANDLSDLRLAQNLPTAMPATTPAPARQQRVQQSPPQAPLASRAPETGQYSPANARPASMETARLVIAAPAHRSPLTAPAPSGSYVVTQGQGANVDRSSVAPWVTLMRSFFQSLPAPMAQGAGGAPHMAPPQQLGGATVAAPRPTMADQPDTPQGAVIPTPRSAVSASVGATGSSGLHLAMAQLDRVLDQLATQFLPRGTQADPIAWCDTAQPAIRCGGYTRSATALAPRSRAIGYTIACGRTCAGGNAKFIIATIDVAIPTTGRNAARCHLAGRIAPQSGPCRI